MTTLINARNVNEALMLGRGFMLEQGRKRHSRNGPTLEIPGLVVTQYRNPKERVLFSSIRDANPFFHLFESVWMIAGKRDVAYVSKFASRMREYSDDKIHLNGAYGFRWREYYMYDQLKRVIDLLQKEPDTRRAVLKMWSSRDLLDQTSKDLPCNTHIYFKRRGMLLDMTVCCRSNDMVWGAYGANAVHMSFLQEYVASQIGASMLVGSYWQVSDSFHVYQENEVWQRVASQMKNTTPDDPYDLGEVIATPLLDPDKDPKLWDRDLALWFEEPFAYGYEHSWWSSVAKPMYAAWIAWKKKDFPAAYDALARMPDKDDWKTAAMEWLERRERKLKEKAQ